MLVKVMTDFIDKHTKVLHEKGSTFSCDVERFNEIQTTGKFVEIIADTEEKKVEEIKPEKKKSVRRKDK